MSFAGIALINHIGYQQPAPSIVGH